jgi:uncharacterized small protein (DUF1192 family)
LTAHGTATNPDTSTREGRIQDLVLDGIPRSVATIVTDLEDRVAALTVEVAELRAEAT